MGVELKNGTDLNTGWLCHAGMLLIGNKGIFASTYIHVKVKMYIFAFYLFVCLFLLHEQNQFNNSQTRQ